MNEDAARLYMADFDVSLRMAEHVEALIDLARKRGLTVDQQSFGWGFAEGLTFMVEHPELAGYYRQLMKRSLSPRLNELLSNESPRRVVPE